MAEYITRETLIQDFEMCNAAFPKWTPGRVKALLLRQPSVDIIPENWTQVDEALPPNGEDVLCWYEYFRFGEYNRMHQTFGIGYQFNGNWGGEVAQGKRAKVLAWMLLPKPPKMERGVTNG